MELGNGSGSGSSTTFPKITLGGRVVEIKPYFQNFGFSMPLERQRLRQRWGGFASQTADRFTIEDLSYLMNMYGYDGSSDNQRMFNAMDSIRSSYCLDHIRYSYGVDGGYDPRVQKAVNAHMSLLEKARMEDRRIREVMEDEEPLPEALQTVINLSIKNGYRPPGFKYQVPVCKPNNEERCWRAIQMWNEQGDSIFRRQDLFQASLALSYYNGKRLLCQQPPYFLEEVLGSQNRATHSTTWVHCNFRARLFNGSSSSLFFAELSNGLLVTFCCIVDEYSGVRGCNICGNEFVHPRDGGYLRGDGGPEEFGHVCGATL